MKDSDGFRVFAPVTSRGEAVGVLELGLDAEPDQQTLAVVSAGAHALAYIVIANRRFTDLFDWGQRSVPLSLEAELQHRLLPASYTCEGGQFTLAGWLEPAGDVGGDTFDFSVERDTLHLSITDAMGHTLNAAVLATVFVGALRNARRRGVNLAQQTQLANEALYGFGDDSDFVTGQVVRVDHASGLARIVNAGHPSPILIREGRAETVKLAPGLPFGISLDYDYRRPRASAGSRRPARLPDRRNPRAQRGQCECARAPYADTRAPRTRGSPGANTSRGRCLWWRASRRRNSAVCGLARRPDRRTGRKLGCRSVAVSPRPCRPALGTFANSGAGSGSLVTRSSPLRDTPEHCADGRVCLLSVASFLSGSKSFECPSEMTSTVSSTTLIAVWSSIAYPANAGAGHPLCLIDRRSPVPPSVGATR